MDLNWKRFDIMLARITNAMQRNDLEVIEAIEPLTIYHMATNLYDCIHHLVAFLIKVTALMGMPRTIISHLLESPEFNTLSK